MLFIIEIVLAIWAYKRGWKSLAFIPLAVGLLLGFMLGMLGIAGGLDSIGILLISLPIDMVLIGVLVTMGVKGRAGAGVTLTTQSNPNQSTVTG